MATTVAEGFDVMNDWLSKIEQHDHEVREQYPELEGKELESERMARVIRELVNYIQHKSQEAWDALSPDAKDLLK